MSLDEIAPGRVAFENRGLSVEQRREHDDFIADLRSTKPVQGLTHQYYRYPARFSPQFVRSIIQAFTKPGDTILDPFMGGATTVVEALSLGRRVIGVDLNPIALFVARVKSTPLSTHEIARTRDVAAKIKGQEVSLGRYAITRIHDPLFVNVPWWIRRTVLRLRHYIERTKEGAVRDFLRCGLLRTAQWALDCREVLPNSTEFITEFCENISLMSDAMELYREALLSAGIRSRSACLSRRRLFLADSASLDQDRHVPPAWRPIQLVLTSPPYPGVHVLYNRWQVRGRRETRAPFLILNQPDGHYASHFTFGPREGSDSYFETLETIYRSVGSLVTSRSLLVQLVSFANPAQDVTRYLRAMQTAGFAECCLGDIGFRGRRRVRRTVPNRKWYFRYRVDAPEAKELLLFHRRVPGKRPASSTS